MGFWKKNKAPKYHFEQCSFDESFGTISDKDGNYLGKMSDNVKDAPYALKIQNASIFGRYYLGYENNENSSYKKIRCLLSYSSSEYFVFDTKKKILTNNLPDYIFPIEAHIKLGKKPKATFPCNEDVIGVRFEIEVEEECFNELINVIESDNLREMSILFRVPKKPKKRSWYWMKWNENNAEVSKMYSSWVATADNKWEAIPEIWFETKARETNQYSW